MATRTVANGGGNYNSTGTWVEGAVPTSADDVVFTATSGSLTINVASAALSINFTNFVNTITFDANLTVSGAVNLGTGGYTQAGSFGIVVNATATLTSGGVTWSRTWTFAGTSQTYTLSGTWTITGNITMSATTTCTINSSTLNIGGNLTQTTTANNVGTTAFVFNGTGTWSNSSTGRLRNSTTVNTSGTLTISGTVYYDTGTFTYTAGTVVTTGSTLQMNLSTTFNTSTLSWNILQAVATSGTNTFTMNSNLTVFEFWAYINGGSTVAFSGANRFTACTNLYLGALGSGFTMSIPNAITCAALAHLGNLTTTFTVNNNSISAPSFTFPQTSGSMNGTTSLILTGGSGTITTQSGGNGRVTNPFTINTSGTVTFSAGNANFTNITYTAGTVSSVPPVLFVQAANTTHNTNPISWNEVRYGGTSAITLTLNSLLRATTLTYNAGTNGSLTISGTGGFNVATWTINSNTTNTHTLTASVTYTVTSAFTAISAGGGAKPTIQGSTAARANLTVTPGATIYLGHINFTNINASGGRTLWAFNPTLTNAVNIRSMNTLGTVGIID